MHRGLDPYGTVGMLVAVVAFISPAAITPPRDTPGQTVRLSNGSEELAYIMGGSGHPIPPDDYLNGIDAQYIQNLYPGYSSEPLFYPAGAEGGFSGPKSLPYDTSVDQGLTILDHTIDQQSDDGNDLVFFGHSQSSAIISLEMAELADSDEAPDPDQLHFVMTGDPGNPNGGLYTRFPGLDLAAHGTTYEGETPADTDYPTDVYTIEYDGFADFPRYPINILADINAELGAQTLHPYANYIDPDNVANAQLLAGSADLDDGTDATNYHIIPTDDLPLLDPIRSMPVIGKPIADLLQPDLKVLVNLGYGDDPEQGWSTPANEPTEFGLLPDIDPQTVLDDLISGAQQGLDTAVDDVESLDPSDLSTALTSDLSAALSPDDTGSDVSADPTSVFTDIVNTLGSAASTVYSDLLPIADVANVLLTSLPAYDVSLLQNGLEEGDLVDALGLPLAANTGIGVQEAFGLYGDIMAPFTAIDNAADTIAADLMSLF
jgi:hypothetical protein